MTKAEFKKLVENGPVILDGATGTNLQKAGMPVGVCPEQWILENPDIMIKLQEDYIYCKPYKTGRVWTCRQIRRNEPGTDRPVPKSGAGKSAGGSGYDDDRTTVISDRRPDV